MSKKHKAGKKFSIKLPNSGSIIRPSAVSKGQHDRVDISREELKNLVEVMRENYSSPIYELRGEIKYKQNKLAYIVSICNSEQRKVLEKLIRESFKDVPREKIIQGTIGSWCTGCLINSNVCSALCAGAIQFNEKQRCKGLVIKANFDKRRKRYQFQIMSRPLSVNKTNVAYIQVEHETYEKFPGFNREELQQLSEYGIQRGYINGINNRRYVQLSSFRSLQEIKSRRNYYWDPQKISIIIWIIVTIILILAIVWFVYRYTNNKYKR